MSRLNLCKKSLYLVNLNRNIITNSLNYNIKLVSNYNFKEKCDYSDITSKVKNDDFSEKSFLINRVIKKNNPDTFGNKIIEEILTESDLHEEKKILEKVDISQKLSTKQYADIIKRLIDKRRLKEACEVLEQKMINEDKVKPKNYIYNLLIGALGRVGYTKKAFSLYNRMKERDNKVHISTYTSLFNACSNSPEPYTDGLSRAQKLRENLIENGVELNISVYNSMIKAFGRCGDLQTAFSIVDEMTSKKFKIKSDTFNFLLQACISDKQAGFRHALLVWRKMISKKINPDVFSYNLLLKCTKECNIGDLQLTHDTIRQIVSQNNENNHKNLMLDQSGHKSDTNDINKDNITSISELRPNLISKTPTLGNLVQISEIIKPEDKLILLGGYTGFLNNMAEYNVSPNVKTYTQLLECMPNSTPLERDLILNMKNNEVVADIDFFNMLMKKRSMRLDYEGAREVLKVMKRMGHRPDVITYGVLALGCVTKDNALELIEEMKKHNYSLNAEILGTMVAQGCHHGDFDYVSEIMQICLKDNIIINNKFKEHLDKLKKSYRYQMNNKKLSKNVEKKFVEWKSKYKEFLQQIRIDENENKHVWEQYETKIEGQDNFKWNKQNRFKPRHISKYRVKTSLKHQ